MQFFFASFADILMKKKVGDTITRGRDRKFSKSEGGGWWSLENWKIAILRTFFLVWWVLQYMLGTSFLSFISETPVKVWYFEHILPIFHWGEYQQIIQNRQ